METRSIRCYRSLFWQSAPTATRAAVAWAEIAPDLTATPVLVAYTEDGRPLDRPDSSFPGDVKGARYVSSLAELRLVNLAHT